MIENSSRKNLQDLLSKVELKIIKREELYLEFDLINFPICLVNTLRRILINDIPTVAIGRINVYNNTSVFSDESLCHRIGLIPLTITKHENVKYKLKVENNSSKSIDIFSDHFQILIENRDEMTVLNENMVGSNTGNGMVPGVFLVTLGPKQILDLECIPDIGTGSMHAKWSPVCPATYKFLPHIGNKVMRDCKVSQINGQKVERNENHVIFKIHSVAIDPLELLKKSFSVLIDKCNNLEEEIDTILGEM